MKPLILAAFALTILPSALEAQFAWRDTEGKHLDLTFGSRSIARYVYEPVDETTPERRNETYKPFCHIYQWWSKDQFITKGPGGKYPHHRGIYFGFSKISYTDNDGVKHDRVDNWHCRTAAQVHREFLKQEAGAKEAIFVSKIGWLGNDKKPFATEERTMAFSLNDSDIIIDFTSTVTPLVPTIRLDGDPQHAGFQFRASQDVFEKTAKATFYTRPETGVGAPGVAINWSAKNDTEETRNLPWKGMTFRLADKSYSVVYLDSPDNPKPARYSERDYGRFGSYFATTVTKDTPLTVNYRLVVHLGEMGPEEMEALSRDFSGN